MERFLQIPPTRPRYARAYHLPLAREARLWKNFSEINYVARRVSRRRNTTASPALITLGETSTNPPFARNARSSPPFDKGGKRSVRNVAKELTKKIINVRKQGFPALARLNLSRKRVLPFPEGNPRQGSGQKPSRTGSEFARLYIRGPLKRRAKS